VGNEVADLVAKTQNRSKSGGGSSHTYPFSHNPSPSVVVGGTDQKMRWLPFEGPVTAHYLESLDTSDLSLDDIARIIQNEGRLLVGDIRGFMAKTLLPMRLWLDWCVSNSQSHGTQVPHIVSFVFTTLRGRFTKRTAFMIPDEVISFWLAALTKTVPTLAFVHRVYPDRAHWLNEDTSCRVCHVEDSELPTPEDCLEHRFECSHWSRLFQALCRRRVTTVLQIRGLPPITYDMFFAPILHAHTAPQPPGRLSDVIDNDGWQQLRKTPRWAISCGFIRFTLAPIVRYITNINAHALHYHPREAVPPVFEYDIDELQNIDLSIPDASDSAYGDAVAPVSSLYRLGGHDVPLRRANQDPLRCLPMNCSIKENPSSKKLEAFTQEIIAAVGSAAMHTCRFGCEFYTALEALSSADLHVSLTDDDVS
jgi:hypothetical protein